MKLHLVMLLISTVFGTASVTAAEPPKPEYYHLSFEDFGFLEDEFVSRSGLKTIEDRGLELVPGRFGRGLVMTRPPSINEQNDMTGTDLDTVTAVVYNTRHNMRNQWDIHNEPFFWGAGKLNTGSGAVAFWARGELISGDIFTQSAMAWGRKEKYLMAVTVGENGGLGAYIVDSRYVRHEIDSNSPWDPGRWNHVVLNWDRSRGLELYLNGVPVASSWGRDAWWQTPLPGLFHIPMPKIACDELYIFPYPLEREDILGLMRSNTPPDSGKQRPGRTAVERDMLADALGLSHALDLPVTEPMDVDTVLSFREITPSHMGDGHVPARFCMDGRYELAWPHQIATFTMVPGDADFQAEQLDIEAPPGTLYNYVTIEGNLTGMPSALMNAAKTTEGFNGRSLFHIPQDGRFFYGVMLDRELHPRFTLPFLKGYGAPGEFTGNIRLPLTGETRVHEVGLFDVTVEDEEPAPGETTYYLRSGGELPGRYDFALRTMEGIGDRAVLTGYKTPPEGAPGSFGTGHLKRIHIATASATAKTCIGRILLDLPLKTATSEDIVLVRLHDPGSPHRIWTHAEVRLLGFEGEGGRLRLLLDSPPLLLAEGDVVWIDLAFYSEADIGIGGPDGGRIVLKPSPYLESIDAYEKKALMPAMAEHMKAYHHRPWIFEKTWPDIANPRSLGGQFDSVMPALAVQRVLPDSRLAKYYVDWAGPKYYWGSFVDPEENFPIRDIPIPEGIPRWAHLQHVIQNFRLRIIDFLVANQNPDGQLWGGWNDDILILRGRPDVPLDSCDRALDMYLKIYEGLDVTNMFGEGFCQIRPIDNHHIGDLVRERFRAAIFKLGDPYVYRRAMETAWHWDKPDQTPFNWGEGKPFLFDKNIVEWYWGYNVPRAAYQSPESEVIDENLSRLASYCDDILFHRFTEARVHTDASTIYNESYITRMILGGRADQSISVAWPEGGGEDLARWVTYADSTKLVCRMFSFDSIDRDVTARLFRIGYGTYDIRVSEDVDGTPGTVLHTERKRMRRFDTFTVPVPPGKPVILAVEQAKRRKASRPLPDLAIAAYDCDRRENTISVRVSNFGTAKSKKTTVCAYNDRGDKVGEVSVPAILPPTDFFNKFTWVDMHDLPRKGVLRLVVDPKDRQTELFEENNTALLP